ncbi:MAG: DUF2156 domain-containing protein [Oscillospiraceae bacterium]|jgi:hypothetical protein|nr:DUF2156 domain-containing protein [Oscillospiraceae bacterium]
MLDFHPIALEDQDWVSAYYKKRDCPGAQYTFAANFIWRTAYQINVCEDEGYFFMRYSSGETGFSGYRCPLGFDGAAGLGKAVDKLAALCRERAEPLVLHNVPPEEQAMLAGLFPSRLTVRPSRDDYEYIYDQAALAALPGKKYHGKKGHVRRFMETNWRYEPITPALIPDALAMQQEWCRINACGNNPELCREGKAAREALNHFEALKLSGGLLYQDGRVVAYTVGEPTGGGVFAVHFEKARSDINGAYPAINQLFVQQAMEGFRLVNREEDTGSEGLRKAKLSYHPVKLLELCNIEIGL